MEKIFKKNKYGIDVVMCCASCAHNLGAKTEHTRICEAGEGEVRPTSLCTAWEMKDSLNDAGKGGGNVKKSDYLMFLLKFEQPKDAAYRVSIDDIRKMYEKKHGSIYINNR